MDILYNGTSLSEYAKILNIKRSILAPQNLSVLDVPGRRGSYFFTKRAEARSIEVEIMIIGDIRSKVDGLAAVLNVDEPVPIIMYDDPGKTYTGIFYGSSDLEEVRETGRGTLTLYLPDPYAESTTETTATFAADGTAGITVEGNAPTYPIVKATFTEAAENFVIMNQDDEFVMVGDPSDLTVDAVPARTTILNDDAETVTGWIQEPTYAADSAASTNTAQMTSDGQRFLVSDYKDGSGVSVWYGATIKKALSETVQDFECEIDTRVLPTTLIQSGRVEMYLMDANGGVLGKVAAKKNPLVSGIAFDMRAGTKSGGRYIYNGYGDASALQRGQFYGMLRLSRKGNVWTAQIAKWRDTYHDFRFEYRKTRTWIDVENKFQAPLAYIAVHISKYMKTQAAPTLHASDVRVFRLNDTSGKNRQIFMPGDELVLDFEKALVIKNDDIFMAELNPVSTFFSLKPGQNTLALNTSTASTDITWKGRWL